MSMEQNLLLLFWTACAADHGSLVAGTAITLQTRLTKILHLA
jgi:hypothetical protein